ncbi:hypothetical protein K466DRAFT_559995 [Polyporus arcularius HHB13444]|uniref:Reverse transcriptase zinc-binding domain-containing protein n=1 Tax=Polyporus arcularius HHB13444 TaxID=1314778 RepID=A0A5C3NRV1_9APHY|nr:hypothetical protein K466DRAFT_559995 [Polyporus arcularius HHB13444]
MWVNGAPDYTGAFCPLAHDTPEAGLEWEAVHEALAQTPPFAPLHIVSTSREVVLGLSKRIDTWEDSAWLDVRYSGTIRGVVAWIRGRSAVTTVRQASVAGSGPRTEEAMSAADAPPEAERAVAPLKFLRDGAKLASLTQSGAYRLMLRKEWEAGSGMRPTTARVVAQVLKDLALGPAEEGKLWTDLRDRDLARKTREFLWKAFHGAQKLGRYWSNIPEMGGRAVCPRCGEEESMQHILLECGSPPVRTIWPLAAEVLDKKGVCGPALTYGAILGCASARAKDRKGVATRPASRLMKIVRAEAAHLIWRLRCEWVIGRDADDTRDHTVEEIRSRWHAVMTRRADLDRSLTSRRFGARALKWELVDQTWRDTPFQHKQYVQDSIPGVLVGRPNAGTGLPTSSRRLRDDG